MRLFHVFPQPTTIRLGERGYLALPLRLRHLAQIESWLASQKANPVDELLDYVHDSQGRERQIRAAEAYLATENWPPELGSAEAEALLLTPQGMQLILGFMLDECNHFEPGDYERIISKLTVGDYKRLIRLAYSVNLKDEMIRIIEPPMEIPGQPKLSWGETIWKRVKDHHWTFAEAGELFLCQLTLVKSEGKSGGDELPYPTRKNIFDAAIEREALFTEAEERIAARSATPDPKTDEV